MLIALFSSLVFVTFLQPVAATSTYTTDQIQQIIISVAKENGLNVGHFLSVAECESGLNPTVQSRYFKEDGTQERSFGLWQINLDKHSDITLQEADDPVWSTNYAAHEWNNDEYKQWECWSILFGSTIEDS